MKKNRILWVFLLVVLAAGPWLQGCTDTATTDAPTRPAPPYNWTDPQLGARLDEALRL
jgi:hypothetical protein